MKTDKNEEKKQPSVAGRLINAALLAAVGLYLISVGDSLGVPIGIGALLFAAYQLLTAAIAQGVKEGRTND